MTKDLHSVCLVGAGYISDIHAECLASIPNLRISAIVDVNRSAAEALGAKWGTRNIFDTVQTAIASGSFERAHLLAPPHLHRTLAEPFIRANIPVLIEKPVCATSAECASLSELIEQTKTPVGVNQNFIYHPAFVQMRAMLDAHQFGPLRYISCIYNVPLRQLDVGQLGHWMFQKPANILLEQAVHPLSQIVEIAGGIKKFTAAARPPVEIAPGVLFYESADISFECAKAPVQLHFAVGQNYPFWQITAVCDDGVIVADMLKNRVYTNGRVRWLEITDHTLTGLATAGQIASQSLKGMMNYALSTIKLKPRSDAFFQSMNTSIRAFHAALDAGQTPHCDAAFGARLVDVCENIAVKIFTVAGAIPTPKIVPEADCDIAVLGGTGFIGKHVINQLVNAGKRVNVMARGIVNLPAIYHHPNVTIVRGDVRNKTDVANAIGNAAVVINLAHGGGGKDWPEIKAAMVGSAQTVADACLAKGVKRLLHVGSIAGMYLGDQDEVITGATPPDTHASNRGDYARAKAEADLLLLRLFKEKSLPVCILRPGVVVGEGSPPFHSGVGLFNNSQHCIGWNAGTNVLPFVLVDDVAAAIVSACSAPAVNGKCYNLVGGARLNAIAYLAALGKATGRPLRFHSQSVIGLQAVEIAKWSIKRMAGRKVGFPSYRDLKSRGMMADFDCSDARRDLNWKPVDSNDAFIRRAIDIFAPKSA